MFKVGMKNEAAMQFKSLLELEPDYHDAHFAIGRLLHEAKDWDAALAHYQKAAELEPGFAVARYNLGHVYFAQKNYQKAKEEFEQTVELRPNFIGAHINLGKLAEAEERPNDAANHYRKVLEQKWEPETAHNLVRILAVREEPSEEDKADGLKWAKRLYGEAEVKSAMLLETLSAAHAQAGEFDEAVRWQTKAIQLMPQEKRQPMQRRLERFLTKQPLRW